MAGILAFVEKVCVQDATYWGPGTNNGYGGKVYPAPITVKVRWDNVAEVITTNDGKEVVSRARILTPAVLEFEGYLRLITAGDPSPNANPREMADAWMINRVQLTPLFRSSTEFVREVFL